VPRDWITDSDIETYAKIDRPLDVPAINRKFPPLYESEPAYLDRLGLLSADERKRLEPDDFTPESIVTILGLKIE
jgi:hypothetical protein